jgi:hypothetical protein
VLVLLAHPLKFNIRTFVVSGLQFTSRWSKATRSFFTPPFSSFLFRNWSAERLLFVTYSAVPYGIVPCQCGAETCDMRGEAAEEEATEATESAGLCVRLCLRLDTGFWGHRKGLRLSIPIPTEKSGILLSMHYRICVTKLMHEIPYILHHFRETSPKGPK